MRQWAEVTTAWTGTGATEESNRPLIGERYTLLKWEDVTGTPSANLHPEPNCNTVRVECEDTVMAQIEADVDFVITLGPVDIEEIPDGP